MRFLWQSNAPWSGTGYGQQTRLMLAALQGRGHQPTCFCYYGLQGGTVMYDDYECLPSSVFDMWGNDVVAMHIRRSQAEVVVTLMDLFVLSPEVWSKLDVPWVAWTPIDSTGIGKATLQRLKMVNVPIAMSHFGANEMREAGIEPTGVIYHAVDTSTYAPADKYEARELLSIPEDAYIVGMVMANKGDRKQFPRQLQAVKIFADKNPDYNVRVYIHTEPTAQMGGWDIRELVESVGLKGRVFSTNQYDTSVVPMTAAAMSNIYNTFDVLMNCSAGEGFGVPIVEAQACGIPVITHGVTAMPEITWNGYSVESDGQGLAGHYGWHYYPSVEDMVYRLECVYRMADKARAEHGRQMVIANCSVDVIAREWDELLTAMGEGLQEKREKARMVIS